MGRRSLANRTPARALSTALVAAPHRHAAAAASHHAASAARGLAATAATSLGRGGTQRRGGAALPGGKDAVRVVPQTRRIAPLRVKRFKLHLPAAAAAAHKGEAQTISPFAHVLVSPAGAIVAARRRPVAGRRGLAVGSAAGAGHCCASCAFGGRRQAMPAGTWLCWCTVIQTMTFRHGRHGLHSNYRHARCSHSSSAPLPVTSVLLPCLLPLAAGPAAQNC